MEGCSKKGEICPNLFDLTPSDTQWFGRRQEGSLEASEEKKLELRLGPPGEDWFVKEDKQSSSNQRDESVFSLGCFSSMASKTNNTSLGAKRGFQGTVETKPREESWLLINNGNQTLKLSSSEKPFGTIFPSAWSSGSVPSPSSPAFLIKTQQQQQQPKHSYLQFPSIPQSSPVMAKESQPCSTKVVDLQNPEKKACSPASANTALPNNSSHKRTAPAPVVGWPPVRSFRKNLASSSASKPAPESTNVVPNETNVKRENCKRGSFVKINMDGVPIGRKVDLNAYDSYEKLSTAVDDLFRGLLASYLDAQKDSFASENQNKTEGGNAISGLLDGSGEYTLVYEDNEGDRMLAGDVPWHMFVSTVKRLRVLKSSEISALRLGSSKQEQTMQ